MVVGALKFMDNGMQSCEEANAELEEIWGAFCIQLSPEMLERFLQRAAELLNVPDHRFDSTVFYHLGKWLDVKGFKGRIWDWLHPFLSTADVHRMVVIQISILEVIPEEPENWEDVFRLLDLLLDRQTQWAVIAAYERQPHKLYLHLKRYLEKQLSDCPWECFPPD